MEDPQIFDSWDDLLASMETAKFHPTDSAWNMYRYLQRNYKEMGSQQVRTLLAAYMALPVERPSLLHSCVLAVAVKVSEEYSDFKFPQFLKYWGYEKNLREEDRQPSVGKDGRKYLALREKVERQLQSYALHHPGEAGVEAEGILTMYAVKVFESMAGGKRRYFAKFVAADGTEIAADSHFFPCKPWEIQGGLFDVSVRTSKQGNVRAVEVVRSQKRVGEAFPTIVGYVGGVDESRGHYHVYDPLSRHFVAEKPRASVKTGDFVMFAPIVPKVDKFKSAAVVSVMPREDGVAAFGTYSAVVSYINRADGYFRYRITSPIAETPEGKITDEGFASLVNVADDSLRSSINVGIRLRLLLFLKRGKDGWKHNHVAEVLAE